MRLPVVAIVGRPNVGKSSLFNRILRRRLAIIAEEPGTTRDRVAAEVDMGDHRFLLMDTGGLELDPVSEIRLGIRGQVDAAVREAEVIIFLCDVAEGVVSADKEVAQMLRSAAKPIVLAVNKADNPRREAAAVEFYELGLGDPLPISAHHDLGVQDLLARVIELLPPPLVVPVEEGKVRVAIVGKPNVGKSMLLNAILGEDRVVVSETPGTTRDAIDTEFEYKGTSFLLIDTAGLRRRGRVSRGVEKFSVMRTLGALNRADVAIVVIDATELLTAQDLHVAGYVQDAYKGLVLMINKCDLVEAEGWDTAEVEAGLRARLKFVPGFPVVFGSALRQTGVTEVLEAALRVHQQRQHRVPTAQLNRTLVRAVAGHVPPSVRGQQLSVYYGTQAETNPPTFVVFVNDPNRVHFSYQRYLENSLRREFGFDGTPIRLLFRARPRVER